MALFEPTPSYTYDDIGLTPMELSKVESRNDVDTSTEFLGLELSMPLVAAPMNTVVGPEMAIKLRQLGGLAFLPRTSVMQDDLDAFAYVYGHIQNEVVVSVGLKDQELVSKYIDMGATRFCLDIANGYHAKVKSFTLWFQEKYPKCDLVVGNVASYTGYRYLNEMGIDAVRVGIGGGSVCTTSIATGVGVGQASLVREVVWEQYHSQDRLGEVAYLIADGGVRTPGDLAKAIALGADVVMAGSVFAGTDEAPGELITQEIGPASDRVHVKYRLVKRFAGQASMHIKGSDKYVEGASLTVDHKGPVENIWNAFADGLRSSMAYMNCHSIGDFQFLDDDSFNLWTPSVKAERAVHAKNTIHSDQLSLPAM